MDVRTAEHDLSKFGSMFSSYDIHNLLSIFDWDHLSMWLLYFYDKVSGIGKDVVLVYFFQEW